MIMESKKGDDYDITMWTVQTKPVIDTLKADGVSYVKKQYIKEKYEETAWIFQEAYGFFVKNAEQIVDRPVEAESPVWMFADKRWAVPLAGSYVLKLQVPKSKLILFDLRSWSRVLNLSYVGTEIQEKEFEQKLIKMGITDSMDVFSKPYYPQIKSEVVKSWERLFTSGCCEQQYTQGAAWMIRQEWIENQSFI